MGGAGRKSGAATTKETTPGPSKPWDVQLTSTAERVYVDIATKVADADERGDLKTAHHTTLRMIDEVIDVVIPHNPVDPKHALSGTLSNIFRYSKGRIRICWIASSEARVVKVLFISDTPRKAGDKRDPYEVFGKLVASGQFDDVFDQLGVTRPIRRGQGDYSIQ